MHSVNYRSSATTGHFRKLTAFVYIFTGINFWFEDVELPSAFVKFNKYIWKFLEVVMIAFVLTAIGALYTQDLTEKEKIDVITKSSSNFFEYTIYIYTIYHKKEIKELVVTLTVTLKKMFNDEKVEIMMIRKSYLFLTALMLVGLSTVLAFVVKAAVSSLTSDATFAGIIPIWPDLEDRSLIAGVARVIIHIVWVLLVVHVIAVYSIIITASICLGHQFAILYEYFLSLNDIFDGDESIEEQEQKYENAVKDGIKMHCIMLNCVNLLQKTCHVAYSGQILFIFSAILLLMIQMMQTERGLMEAATIVFMVAAVLLSSGVFIWSAADITFEAQRLPTAIFHSGWHNCRGKSSVRMRKTITIAMAVAQILKASYSVFSVIY